MNENIEREVKFLNIDVPQIKAKLAELGAEDHGEHLLCEVIFYPKNSIQVDGDLPTKYVRIRTSENKSFLTYKNLPKTPAIGVEEIEIEVSDAKQTESLLIALGWEPAREQEKRRHSFKIGETFVEIDYWPGEVLPYIEIEGATEEIIRSTAEDLGLNWADHALMSAGKVLKKYYNINVKELKKFTFSEIS